MIKTIALRYDEKDYKELKSLKDKKGLSWEDFVYWAIIINTMKVEK